jgi:adenylyltransferase/sulfurtransferase
MTENDYRLINLRYSCPLLRHEDLQAGRVPTSPTISAVIGGWQAQEALKLIHGMPVNAGQAMVYNGVANQFYRTQFQFREDCLSHETYPDAIELPLQRDVHTAADLFQAVRRDLGFEPLRLALDRDLVVSLVCEACATTREVMKPLAEVGIRRAACPSCGETQRPETVHAIDVDSPLANERFSRLGIPPYDIVLVEGVHDTCACLFAGDRE